VLHTLPVVKLQCRLGCKTVMLVGIPGRVQDCIPLAGSLAGTKVLGSSPCRSSASRRTCSRVGPDRVRGMRVSCVLSVLCSMSQSKREHKELGTEAGSAHSPQQASQVFPPASSLQPASHPFNQPPLSHQARTHRARGLPLPPHALIAAPLCRHPAAVDQYCAVGAWLPQWSHQQVALQGGKEMEWRKGEGNERRFGG
jgi:hypothetical protein